MNTMIKILRNLIAVVILAISLYISSKFPVAKLDQENLYWIFSASAQSIAAFVGFFLAGYALFHSIMNEVASADDSLSDIVLKRKKNSFSRIRVLLVSTGISIILNLLMIFLNNRQVLLKNQVIALTFLSTIGTIIIGLFLVAYIIDPNRNAKIAKELVQSEKSYGQTGKLTAGQNFFSRFIELEQRLRSYTEKRKILVKSAPRQWPSIRDLIDALQSSGRINSNLHERLLGVTNYRNLLFHGKIEEASEIMVHQLDSLLNQLEKTLHGF